MAESQQGKFNSQHVADRRFHGCFTPGGSFLALLVLCLNLREFSDDASASGTVVPSGLRPHPEERRLRRVSKDEGPTVASWFETAQVRLLIMRGVHSTPQNMQPGRAVLSLALSRHG
jgi:hypothetical protein